MWVVCTCNHTYFCIWACMLFRKCSHHAARTWFSFILEPKWHFVLCNQASLLKFPSRAHCSFGWVLCKSIQTPFLIGQPDQFMTADYMNMHNFSFPNLSGNIWVSIGGFLFLYTDHFLSTFAYFKQSFISVVENWLLRAARVWKSFFVRHWIIQVEFIHFSVFKNCSAVLFWIEPVSG